MDDVAGGRRRGRDAGRPSILQFARLPTSCREWALAVVKARSDRESVDVTGVAVAPARETAVREARVLKVVMRAELPLSLEDAREIARTVLA